MVSVTHALSADNDTQPLVERLCEGLDDADAARVVRAVEAMRTHYGDAVLGTGENTLQHALGMALICVSLKMDVEARIAALCFALHAEMDNATEYLEKHFGARVARLVGGMHRLNGLRVITRRTATAMAPEMRMQAETLRKMLLAMVEDIRVVLMRLASRTQTLRYYAGTDCEARKDVARESLDIYAPLANRLGVWQLKWELEDLSFRFLEPETYKRVAKMLDERRVEREQFITDAIARLEAETRKAGVKADVFGRPKHIYSIYHKMHSKKLDFSQLYDVRALRVLVDEVKDCYTVLGIVHQMWTPIPKEYDDYILKPKGNHYQSLHTAVMADDGRALEVQIRTHDMHRHAEYGVAAHWRYKEGSGPAGSAYDEKIALLRSLLSWRDEISDADQWEAKYRDASMDDTIYAITPQGRVVDLPRGATPIDFAYTLHTELGHRCRGAKVDGQLVPLNTPLESGQTVEITVAKEGGPSRDWLNPQQGYVATGRARRKIKQHFSQLEQGELLERGRSVVHKELQREGQTQANIEALATRMGFKTADAMFMAAGRGDVGPRAVQVALQGPDAETPAADEEVHLGRARSGHGDEDILVVGVGKLMTSLARCCKPAPPDAIEGFVTRGRGISVHRVDCHDFKIMARRNPERVIPATWGGSAVAPNHRYPIDLLVQAVDRQGLLRDITDVLSREHLNVIAVNTLTKKGKARMRFTVEVSGAQQVQRALALICEVPGIDEAQRA
ncbi:bifunctional (p)ppGpp synthetase/guanosine-3',5'-bis(diphosphate) 3'-pyrophosphohydrolase [Nitrogeniibacter mangrovi]|uniref:GTP pyrophosphokinase n=1 Tax=Nitrogeniibacter mangrovi TaxID=2016596 RepID=A0A6C1B2P1_9RHOO|nr:bifunctional (p)ppGpp synthetase/guanosine-3',5'-bis(diphosphate) 3'-pyrophosphohydrolase [Nitrogeniibacter mangrovi]QID17827.1 bifunctional (p)ppGpp synthetase/guanosine-3',5'-bis(diphosphate) 3'-pyrophosphohydrolase [Nitrogeniibacter mangrovi]